MKELATKNPNQVKIINRIKTESYSSPAFFEEENQIEDKRVKRIIKEFFFDNFGTGTKLCIIKREAGLISLKRER